MKYRFVKKRQEISTEDINSMKDFDTVLKGSRRLLDFAYKGKLLWTLTVPVAIVTYILVTNQSKADEPVNIEEPLTKEIASDLPEATIEELPENKPEEKTVTPTEVKEDEPKAVVSKPVPAQEKLEQPSEEIESSKDLLKEDVYLKAEPVNGFEDFYAFIDKELTYPELARKDSIQGQVKVLFAIDEMGKVDRVTIVESLGDLFDNEAIRVIKRVPDWNAATFNGEPVLSRMSIILTFKIQ
jgi:periplasmic protein TonB